MEFVKQDMSVHCLIPYADVTSGMHTVDIGIDAGEPAGSQNGSGLEEQEGMPPPPS